MYINIERKIKCSKCSSVNENKDYWLGNTQFRECDSCGHKVILGELTSTISDNITTYNANTEEIITY